MPAKSVDPTPEEIESRAAKIRTGWTGEQEPRGRTTGKAVERGRLLSDRIKEAGGREI